MSKCNPKCPYFPDMSIKEGDWIYDKDKPYIKKRKNPKIFKCGYDDHPINWEIECPRDTQMQKDSK